LPSWVRFSFAHQDILSWRRIVAGVSRRAGFGTVHFRLQQPGWLRAVGLRFVALLVNRSGARYVNSPRR
jgi:hypothetical protein